LAKNPQSKDAALEALDFIVNVLKEHEQDLDKLINELATVTEQMGDSGELSGKVDKVEEKISILQKEVTSLLSHLSSASQQVLPKQASVELPKQVEHTVALLGGGPLVVLRCKQWSDFQTLAAKAQTLSFNIKQEERQFQVDALKNNQLITYTGDLPMLTTLLKTYLASQLNVSEQSILEGILSLN
jgi:uncharacterized coiled-coil protein SlyX